MQQKQLGKWELRELEGFCRQYDMKRKQAADILLQVRSGTPHGSGGRGTPQESEVERKVWQRERLLRDIRQIEECARGIEGGRWYKALIQNICRGIGYTYLDKVDLPTSCRNSYFQARKAFFLRLWWEREGIVPGA